MHSGLQSPSSGRSPRAIFGGGVRDAVECIERHRGCVCDPTEMHSSKDSEDTLAKCRNPLNERSQTARQAPRKGTRGEAAFGREFEPTFGLHRLFANMR